MLWKSYYGESSTNYRSNCAWNYAWISLPISAISQSRMRWNSVEGNAIRTSEGETYTKAFSMMRLFPTLYYRFQNKSKIDFKIVIKSGATEDRRSEGAKRYILFCLGLMLSVFSCWKYTGFTYSIRVCLAKSSSFSAVKFCTTHF